MTVSTIVVVGASLAGLRACETLRLEGFDGSIVLVGDERGSPYDRPPLSKKVLAGEWELDRIALRKPDDIGALALDARLGIPATALDAAARRVVLGDGSAVDADGIIVCTGATPRRLPGQPDAAGVHVLRRADDALALRDQLRPGTRLVVIGAGFVGLEVAATAVGRGVEVTVLEAGAAPMERAFGAQIGAEVASVHARHGVPIRCGVAVEAIEVEHRAVRAVVTSDGQRLPADTVLVAVGAVPNVHWLQGSGIEVGNGVICDATLATTTPGVFAAGDCAQWVNPLFGDDQGGEAMRVEHWTNAAEQGAAAAANLLRWLRGEPLVPFESVPFVWSDQFDSRIQFVGRAHGGDEIHRLAGDPSGPFAVLYGHGGRLRAALGVSMPKLVMPFRKLLAQRASWEQALDAAAALVR